MGNQTFTNQRSIAVMDRISNFLEDQGRATSAEVAVYIGMSLIHIGRYMAQLEQLGRIQCLQRPVHIQNGRTQPVWGPVGAADGDDVDAPGRKGFERTVTVLKEWVPNHARMPLDCLLFGVPVAMQGVAT